jgi:hypothetical protein
MYTVPATFEAFTSTALKSLWANAADVSRRIVRERYSLRIAGL